MLFKHNVVALMIIIIFIICNFLLSRLLCLFSVNVLNVNKCVFVLKQMDQHFPENGTVTLEVSEKIPLEPF